MAAHSMIQSSFMPSLSHVAFMRVRIDVDELLLLSLLETLGSPLTLVTALQYSPSLGPALHSQFAAVVLRTDIPL